MITDRETNTIYYSKLLPEKYPVSFGNIKNIMDERRIDFFYLRRTNDIWARDYMPIQAEEYTFVEFRYDPDYLQGSEKGCRDTKTYTDLVCKVLWVKTKKSDIILDGGNVIKSKKSIILTDKILVENQFRYNREELISELERRLQIKKIVLIPWDRSEEYGHADGMVRFIDDETVLVNDDYKDDKKVLDPLIKAGFKVKTLNYKVKKQSVLSWAYLNFLQTRDLLLIPKLGIEADSQALEQISKYYPDYAGKNKIEQVEMRDIVEEGGGALNCLTWTVWMED
jgi:agmatine deiminase